MATVEQLLHLWQMEGFKTTKIGEETEPMNKKLGWELWTVVSDKFYTDYGRHGVVRVLFRIKTREIVKDELFNASVRDGENLYAIPVRGNMG